MTYDDWRAAFQLKPCTVCGALLPDDWPARKFYWRRELRRKLNRALVVKE